MVLIFKSSVMKLTLIIFVLLLLNISAGAQLWNLLPCLLRSCRNEIKRENCSDENCYREKVENCFKSYLGDDWKDRFWPAEFKDKYDANRLIDCQARSLYTSEGLMCLRRSFRRCLREKFGDEFFKDLSELANGADVRKQNTDVPNQEPTTTQEY